MMLWLDETYCFFNSTLFKGELPQVFFTINADRKAIFHFVPPYTMEVCAKMDEVSSITEVLDDLLHSMIHIANHRSGLPDYTANQYHNAHFCSAALSLGFYVVKSKGRGWAITFSNREAAKDQVYVKPSVAANKKLRSAISQIKLNSRNLEDLKGLIHEKLSTKNTREYLLRYVCRCEPPYNAVRTGRKPDGDHPLNATCNDCGACFQPERKNS
jgi:hypothetical protein